ncbi:MAG: asparagine synthase (glutamine-hydrolyzing) [Acidobacteriota bacterium]|nr:asparagine synthase (glutamine-hydrolyzing) [Acidobacteriota bacterium]
MCGIAGYVLRDAPARLDAVRAMCDQIRYRGPDDDGYHVDGPCAIGMRRLAIIDLSTGHQPMTNEDHSLWVVFNGEIYDYQALHADLVAQGHRFTTKSDTETLLHLYEQEGVAGISKLRGMFAYALWNARDRTLLLVRDRFGKKPLYYADLPTGLYFGSELKCLRTAGVPLDLDRDALKLYFQFGYIPDPWSPYAHIRKLAPGSWLRYHADSDRVEQGRYWEFPVPAEHAAAGFTESSARDQIRHMFDESVRIRMIADVPLGAFLSGGIDSSSVVASMALHSRNPVKTFSIGFRESGFNELPWAKMVAEKYHTEHHEIIVEPDSVGLVQRLVHHFDEPFADSSAIPTFLVSEFAARYVKVVLTGDGGDELFAGYESFDAIDRLRYLDHVPLPVRALLSGIASRLPYSAYGKNYLRMISRPTALQRYFELNYTPWFLRQRLLSPEWLRAGDTAFTLPDSPDILTQALYFEATAKLTGDMLVKVDRMSMANSLEVRCPLLDHELAELAARIPHAWKLRNRKGKAILIDAIGDRLPPEILTRPKMGFGVPLPLWFRGSLREFLWDNLTSARFLDRGIVSPAFVRHLLAEHDTSRRDNAHWLWMLLMLDQWFVDVGQVSNLRADYQSALPSL